MYVFDSYPRYNLVQHILTAFKNTVFRIDTVFQISCFTAPRFIQSSVQRQLLLMAQLHRLNLMSCFSKIPVPVISGGSSCGFIAGSYSAVGTAN